MAAVKWIKICTDIFDDEKMQLIDAMPDRDGIIVIWFKLLCMAGKQNNGGVFMLNDKIAYTDEMLSTIFRRPINTVRLALQTFEQFGMIEIVNNAYIIPNWEKHQSLDKLMDAKEKTRLRVAKHREKQKLLAHSSGECNVTETLRNVTVTPLEEDKDKEEDKEIDKEKKKVNYQLIADMYNEICISLPSVTSLSETRKKAIKARLNKYTVEQVKEVFTKAQASDFLKGTNSRNWAANFDWLMKDANFAKVLDGNYDNKKQKSGNNQASYDISEYERRTIDDWEAKPEPKTAADDENIKARAEALQRRFANGG